MTIGEEFSVEKRQAYFPNLDNIAYGYDAYLGDPHADGKDPGFKGKIFELDYSQGKKMSDGKWFIPNGVDVCFWIFEMID